MNMKTQHTHLFVRFALMFGAMVSGAMVSLLASEYYRVSVSRIDSNLYRDHNSKTLIETRYCYEYATRDDAVLRWEGRYGNNKLVFSSGTTCEVVALR
jgi:hypothetical protein